MEAWVVLIGESDGTGGSNAVKYRFKEYDDAHAFYEHIKSLNGTPFHPYVMLPPTRKRLKLPKVYASGEWPDGWRKK